MNCRKCKNRNVCKLISMAGQLDGEVSVVYAEGDISKTMDRYPNIIFDTLAQLLPKCCTRFDCKDKPESKWVFPPLTPAKKSVLDIIQRYYKQYDYCPSVREIADKLNKSTATILEHINSLHSDGYLIKRFPGSKARNYTINPDYKQEK